MTRLDQALAELAPLLASLVRAAVADALADQPKPAPTGLISVAEYARRRSLSPSTVRQAIRDGRLEASRYGRAVRVSADAEIGRRVPVPTAQTSPEAFAMRVLASKGGAR